MNSYTNDHEITIGTDTKRLKLIREKGQPLYNTSEDAPEHLDRILFRQNNWIGGHGQYGLSDSSMYFDGQSVDTTQDGRVLLGPKITEDYLAGTLYENYFSGDDGMEDIWAYTSGMIEYDYRLAQTFTPSHDHTITSVCLKMYRIGNPGNFRVAITAVDGDGHPAGVALCYGDYNGDTLTTDTSGAWISVTLGDGAALTAGTKYAIYCYRIDSGGTRYNKVCWRLDSSSPSYAGGNAEIKDAGGAWVADTDKDFMFEERSGSTTELDSAPVLFFWSSSTGRWLCATAGKIYYYTTGWTPATTDVAGVTGFAEFNGYVFAALGSSTDYYYSSDCDTWTASNLTDNNAHANYFLSAPNPAKTANVLWKARKPNEIQNNTSGINGGGDYDSVTYVGDTSNDITNMFLCGGKLMVGREDNLYEVDSAGGITPLMDELKVARTAQNFKYVVNWQGNSYFSIGTGVCELTSSSILTKIGPLQNTGDIDKVGTVVGMAADTDYLYVAMAEGTVTHIYKGRPVGTQWQWCPLVYLGTNACSAIGIAQHSTTDKRLWFGYGTHTGYVYISDNPTADANARFAASGWLRMSYAYGSNPYWDKMIQSVITETENCAAGITVTPKYRKDTTTTMTALTSAIATNGVIKTNLSSALTGTRWQFEVDLATNDSTITPVVRLFEVHGHEKPTTYKVHECTYNIYSDPNTKPSTLISFLEGGRTSTSLIKFARLNFGEYTGGTAGTDYKYVIMEPGYPQVIPIYNEKNQQGDFAVKCRFRETNFS